MSSCAPDSFQDNIPDEPGQTTTTDEFALAFLDAVNAYRESGCTCGVRFMPPAAPLQWDDLLSNAAQRHANDMGNNGFFSHTGSDGSSSSTRVTDAGYNWQSVGENIAFGYSGIEAAVDAWINSEGHCRNIMNASFTEMGAARKGTYWVQDLGKPR
ncbi:MAG: hypothetical protein DHS20C18_34640 [Saprospiraceae bacterium]|nr:MAG: hypothetical protein DHS20C18_34640 [Saprospiraceae bacterium]